ncbi:MAG: 6-phosphogluconolactonase [Phycisphaeraceae bacterium]
MGLQLTGNVHVAQTPDQLYDDLAAVLMVAALRAAEARGVFHLALSGGSTPEPFYVRLVTDPRYRALPWNKTHLWLVDERRVDEHDDRSNYKMIRESLANHVSLRRRQCHPMPVLAKDPAGLYEDELRRIVDPNVPVPRLDFVVLGMGDDAHTASLFPGSPALSEALRLIVVNDGPTVTPPDRVTMTYPLLNAARHVAVLVTGQRKAATLRRVNEHLRTAGPDPQRLPITGIDPASGGSRADGNINWYLDAAAAGDG